VSQDTKMVGEKEGELGSLRDLRWVMAEAVSSSLDVVWVDLMFLMSWDRFWRRTWSDSVRYGSI
jgi:hypothetical protein